MMVVHENDETSMEVAQSKIERSLEQKSYVIVNNHVRELINTGESTSNHAQTKEKSPQKLETSRKKKRKLNKNLENFEQTPITSAESEEKTHIETEIDENDISELRSVYMKCKEVMSKIETKYGHLLNLDNSVGLSSCRKRKHSTEDLSDDECHCELNKKIVFDDDGKQSVVEMVSEKHICVKKGSSKIQSRSRTIAVEYNENEINLPDNLQELGRLLQDPDIEITHRNKIAEKIRMLKQEYNNNLRFHKRGLIEKIKANPDEVLGFKGTNLSTIRGYL